MLEQQFHVGVGSSDHGGQSPFAITLLPKSDSTSAVPLASVFGAYLVALTQGHPGLFEAPHSKEHIASLPSDCFVLARVTAELLRPR